MAVCWISWIRLRLLDRFAVGFDFGSSIDGGNRVGSIDLAHSLDILKAKRSENQINISSENACKKVGVESN